MQPDYELDITDQTCPMTFVRTKLVLERMTHGQLLKVVLRGDEPRRNVPEAVLDHGHEVVSLDSMENDRWALWVRVR